MPFSPKLFGSLPYTYRMSVCAGEISRGDQLSPNLLIQGASKDSGGSASKNSGPHCLCSFAESSLPAHNKHRNGGNPCAEVLQVLISYTHIPHIRRSVPFIHGMCVCTGRDSHTVGLHVHCSRYEEQASMTGGIVLHLIISSSGVDHERTRL